MRLLGHQRALMEAAQDQLELTGICVDVANRKNAGNAGLESGSLDRNQIFLELDAPVRDGSELHGETKERQHRVAGYACDRVVVALHLGAGQHTALALQRGNLTDLEIKLAGRNETAHLLDTVGGRTNVVTTMQQRHALGDRLQIEGPVER